MVKVNVSTNSLEQTLVRLKFNNFPLKPVLLNVDAHDYYNLQSVGSMLPGVQYQLRCFLERSSTMAQLDHTIHDMDFTIFHTALKPGALEDACNSQS